MEATSKKNTITLGMKKYLLFLLMLAPVIGNAQNFDINVLKITNQNRNKNLDNFFVNYSNMVGVTTVGTPIVVYTIGLLKKNKSMQINGINLAVSAGINSVLTVALKNTVNRDRPGVTYPTQLSPLYPLTKHSFPSGHTSSAFNTATKLTMQYPKWYVAVPSFTYAALMGYSRMHAGVHYPSDVAAGALLGAGSAFISKKITTYLQRNAAGKKVYHAITF
jgi:membrane-associated phospholipid phosphatase